MRKRTLLSPSRMLGLCKAPGAGRVLWSYQSHILAKAEQPDPLVSTSLRSAEEKIISVDASAPLSCL